MKYRKPARLCFVLLLTVFFFTVPASAQTYLLRSKKAVIRLLHNYNNKLKTHIEVTDSTAQLQVRDSAFRNLEITCYFNAKNKCYKQTRTTDCAECFDKYFLEVMNQNRYDWKKVSDNMYLSKPFWATVLLIDPAVPFSFSMVHEYFSREEQKEMYKKAN
jgi:hypothetical protein